MFVFATGLTIPEARLVEQAAISAYTVLYLENARREIAVGNISKFTSYMNAITDLIGNYIEEELLNFLGG